MRYHTIESANSMLPMIRASLQELRDIIRMLSESEEAVAVKQMVASGADVSQPVLFRRLLGLLEILQELHERRIILRDVSTGLVDFPARYHSREIFLCWKEDEPSVQYWHPVDTGFGGRRPISDLR
ncbi:MAG: DUF2203 family protein [bacterium JZ-2024 1]